MKKFKGLIVPRKRKVFDTATRADFQCQQSICRDKCEKCIFGMTNERAFIQWEKAGRRRS